MEFCANLRRLKQAGSKDNQMRYAVVIENAGPNFSAFVPDLPGCVATGDTLDEVKAGIAAAIRIHVRGLVEDGLPVPPASSQVDYIAA